MSAEEVAAFEAFPGWREAVELRRWDDLAKDPDAKVSSLEAYEDDLRAVISSNHDAGP